MSAILTDIAEAIERFAKGEFLIVVDDADRENEGDLIVAGAKITDEQMAFLIRHTSGIICSAISVNRARELNLPIMVRENEDTRRTAFTVSIDAKAGLTTGISATERANSVRLLANPGARAADFIRPGHIFPLIAHPEGLAARGGHTEAGLTLCQLSNQGESGVLSELVNDDGTVMKGDQIAAFSEKYSIPVITIEDLTKFALTNLSSPGADEQKLSWADLPHETGNWHIATYKASTGIDHAILKFGEPTKDQSALTLIRAHSECLTGDAFGSLRCDCGQQLRGSFEKIVANGAGYIFYLRGQEGRGIGLSEKIKAYVLQDQGLDTIDANIELGHSNDLREWQDLVEILDLLKVGNVELITNNLAKIDAITQSGRTVTRVSIAPEVNEFNRKYLQTKKDKMHHMLGEI